jgi:aldose 1-epimerase
MIARGITTIAGRAVDEARLTAGNMELHLLSYGAVTRDWRVGGRSIVLGYDDPADYGSDRYYQGAIVGRVANRIRESRFLLEGKEVVLPANDGAHHLHGGPGGISKQHWTLEEDRAANAVRLSYTSPDGEGGYPGRADFEVVVSLSESRLSYEMRAEVDRPTPIALAQHNYYNLTGGEIWDHVLTVPAEEYLLADAELIMTGDRAPVQGSRYDFRRPTRLGHNAPGREMMDACLVLSPGVEPAAVLTAPGAPTLSFITDQPGLQLYNSNTLGPPFAPFTGICLEPEAFPDAVHHAGFPPVKVWPGAPYRQRLSIEVS